MRKFTSENATGLVVYTRNRDVAGRTGVREKICTCESIKPIRGSSVRYLTTGVMAVHALTVADDLDLDSSRARPGLDPDLNRPASPCRALVVVSGTFAPSELGLALRHWFVRGTDSSVKRRLRPL